MLLLGIDVVILSTFGLLLVLVSYLVSRLLVLTEDAGRAAMLSTLMTAASMVLFYVFMYKVLDAIVAW